MNIKNYLDGTYRDMEGLVDDLFDIYFKAIELELGAFLVKASEDITWISMGYEQGFSLGYGTEDFEERIYLISVFEDSVTYHDKISSLPTMIKDKPFYNSLLSSFIVKLENAIKSK